MAIVRALAIIKNPSALPKDHVVNNWWFFCDALSPANADAIDTRLTDFYQAIDGFMPQAMVAAAGHEIRLYDMGDPEPRVPWAERDFTLAPALQDPLPNEVALVLSYHGVFASGIPNARRRGRVYLGPWTKDAVDSNGRPSASSFLPAIDGAATALLAANTAGVIWSQRSEVLGVLNDVVGGYVDNAWDTQRRRGLDATTRVGFGTDG